MQIQCCNESKQSLWAYDVSPLLSTHIFLSIIANCIMKVEFSYKIFALYSRYSRLNHPIGNPDSNLAALNGEAEYSNTIREFNRNISSQNHETEIERGQGLSRKLRNTVLMCRMRRGGPRPKLPSPIRAAECFQPLLVFMGVESRRKIETGLERGQGLSR